MCGITGFISHNSMRNDFMSAVINKMTDSLNHRGPDGSGIWIDDARGVALGHRRLSIIDLSEHGKQPMMSDCGRYILVYNGEIYNYDEIKKELDESESINWQSNSDTEVVLNAVKIWGLEKAINKFIGMFAFALWDKNESCLYLVRDRLGIKPLYWTCMNNNFVFASELKAFTLYPDLKLDLDLNSLASYMRHNYIPESQTIYKDVNKLLPGSYLVYKKNHEPNYKKYWDLKNFTGINHKLKDISNEELILAETERLLSDAVNKRMIADVSLGTFLSGGIDSSTVVALMQKNSMSSVKTFSIGFNEASFNEAQYAKDIAAHLGTEHTEFYISDKDAMDVIPLLADIYDEPFSDSSQIPTFLVSKLTREHVTVALSGDGGDEVFAGYNRYFFANNISKKLKLMTGPGRYLLKNIIENVSISSWDKLFELMPKKYSVPQAGDKLYKLASAISKNELDVYKHLVSHWDEIDSLVPGATCYDGIFSTDYSSQLKNGFVEAMQYIDTKTYLPDDILTKVDRASMAVSLEVRVPLLDHRLIEYAWSLPLSMKMKNGKSKWLLRQILNKYVPESLVDRPKMGFGIPIGQWLSGPLRDWAESLLDEKKIREQGVLNYEPIKLKWEEHLSGKRNWQYHIWDILMFQAWSERWL